MLCSHVLFHVVFKGRIGVEKGCGEEEGGNTHYKPLGGKKSITSHYFKE